MDTAHFAPAAPCPVRRDTHGLGLDYPGGIGCCHLSVGGARADIRLRDACVGAPMALPLRNPTAPIHAQKFLTLVCQRRAAAGDRARHRGRTASAEHRTEQPYLTLR